MSTGIAEGDAFKGMHVPGNKSAVSSQDVTTMMVLSNMHKIQGQQMETIEALSKRLDRIEASTEVRNSNQLRMFMSTFHHLQERMCDQFHRLQMQMVTCKLESLLNVGFDMDEEDKVDKRKDVAKKNTPDTQEMEMIQMVQQSQVSSQDSKNIALFCDDDSLFNTTQICSFEAALEHFGDESSRMQPMSDEDERTCVYNDVNSLAQLDGHLASNSTFISQGREIDLYCHETLKRPSAELSCDKSAESEPKHGKFRPFHGF